MKQELKELLNEYVESVSHFNQMNSSMAGYHAEPTLKGFISWLNENY